jgi:hypothetical protein
MKSDHISFDHDVEDEDGEILDTVQVTALFEPYVPERRRGHPDNWTPAEGGGFEGLDVFLDGKNVTKDVDTLYGDGTYDRIVKEAEYRYSMEKLR